MLEFIIFTIPVTLKLGQMISIQYLIDLKIFHTIHHTVLFISKCFGPRVCVSAQTIATYHPTLRRHAEKVVSLG